MELFRAWGHTVVGQNQIKLAVFFSVFCITPWAKYSVIVKAVMLCCTKMFFWDKVQKKLLSQLQLKGKFELKNWTQKHDYALLNTKLVSKSNTRCEIWCSCTIIGSQTRCIKLHYIYCKNRWQTIYRFLKRSTNWRSAKQVSLTLIQFCRIKR